MTNRHTLTLKSANTHHSKPDIAKRDPARGKRKTIVIERKKPSASALNFKRPSGTPRYEEIFDTFKPELRTVGEDILVIRAWLHKSGIPPMPEEINISTFATVAARFLLPRRDWQMFTETAAGQCAARKFLREWSIKLLPVIVKGGRPRNQPVLPSWAIPEMAWNYSPEFLGREVE